MTDNIATLPWMDDHFGNCPHCHKTDGCYSVERDDWYVCHTHRTKWLIGSNLFSSWRDMREQDFLANAYRLAGYREVKPWLPDNAQMQRLRLVDGTQHGPDPYEADFGPSVEGNGSKRYLVDDNGNVFAVVLTKQN
jgi:hypothetical protein